jgi:hypothetical protein
VAEVWLSLDRRSLDPGCPVVLLKGWPPRAYYDPMQIKREQAAQVLEILAPRPARWRTPGDPEGETRAGCPPAEESW